MDRFEKFSFVLLCLFQYLIKSSTLKVELPICNWPGCDTTLLNSSVESFCQVYNYSMWGRCCLATNTRAALNFTDVVGVDLFGCQLQSLRGLFKNYTSIQVLNLANNSIESCLDPDNWSSLSNISSLTLPSSCGGCPGNESAWESMQKHGGVTVCSGEMDTCTVQNVTCPKHSACVNDGPGSFLCLCRDGWGGYRCLRKGQFPVLAFSAAAAGGTVVLALLLRVTARRKAKSS